MLIDNVRAKREQIAAQAAEQEMKIAHLEQILADLRRALDMTMGALKALDELLTTDE